MAQEKGTNDMTKWIGVLITVSLICAGAVYRKAENNETRVTKLENDMAFFKGTVTVQLSNQEKRMEDMDRKLDSIIKYMMGIDFEETKDAK